LSSFRQPFAAIFFAAVSAAIPCCTNLPANPATLAAPALQGRFVLRGGQIVSDEDGLGKG
ncbi:hypothetical protein, partial [Cupriavidus taiwanensis]|uniref:hypothetical protein n=1 Tax=Cupriavidus taiwanensis TaxID=164546 RepID=UPI001C2D701E